MIYLDNAATTYPKPLAVQRAVGEALRRYGANPGRSGHAMAAETAEQVYACRERVAEFFGLDDPAGVIFTTNCTMALNMVIKGLLHSGDHVVISCLEHNSVIRPLTAVGAEITEVTVHPRKPWKTVEGFRAAIRADTRLMLCTHASNVCGVRLPIREIGAVAHRFGIPFAVDAAQSAGVLPLDMRRDHIDFLCMPGHKALYGPMGTGLLLCREKTLSPLMEGGTGSMSLRAEQPDELPDRLESGTINVPGICGLHAGVRFVSERGCEEIAARETMLMQRLYDRIGECDGITVHSPRPTLDVMVPLVTLTVAGQPSEQTAARLSDAGIASRAGLHCAPTAHRFLGTVATGAVRLCPSVFTTVDEVDITAKILTQIAKKTLQSSQSVIQ